MAQLCHRCMTLYSEGMLSLLYGYAQVWAWIMSWVLSNPVNISSVCVSECEFLAYIVFFTASGIHWKTFWVIRKPASRRQGLGCWFRGGLRLFFAARDSFLKKNHDSTQKTWNFSQVKLQQLCIMTHESSQHRDLSHFDPDLFLESLVPRHGSTSSTSTTSVDMSCPKTLFGATWITMNRVDKYKHYGHFDSEP